MKTSKKRYPTFRVGITGGTGSVGLPLLIESAKKKFAGRGVLFIPEVATVFLAAGIEHPRAVPRQTQNLVSASYQSSVGYTLFGLETYYADLEYETGARIMLVERPLLDGAAFAGLSPEKFCEQCLPPALWMGKQLSSDEKVLKVFERYHTIIHLETHAAVNGEEYERIKKTLNPHNIDSAAEALAYDRAFLKIWKRHPRRIIIAASESLERKEQLFNKQIEMLLNGTAPVSDKEEILERAVITGS